MAELEQIQQNINQIQENSAPEAVSQNVASQVEEAVFSSLEYMPHQKNAKWSLYMLLAAVVVGGIYVVLEGLGAISFIAALGVVIWVYAQTHAEKSAGSEVPLVFYSYGIMHGNNNIPYTDIDFIYIHPFSTHITLGISLKKEKKLDEQVYFPTDTNIEEIRALFRNHKISENFSVKESWLDFIIRTLQL